MHISMSTDWFGAQHSDLSLECLGQPEPAPRWEGSRASLSLRKGDSVYFASPGARRLLVRPDPVLAPPLGAADLAIDVESDGLILSFWIIEFDGETHIGSQRWRLADGKARVIWTPANGANGVRLALRAEGAGMIGPARLTAATHAKPEASSTSTVPPPDTAAKPVVPDLSIKASAQDRKNWLSIWDALHLPKAKLVAQPDSVLSAALQPDVRLTSLDHIRLEPDRKAGAEAQAKLAAFGIDGAQLDLDRLAYGLTISTTITAALKDGLYSARCPFSGEQLHSSDSFVVPLSSGRPSVFVRYESRNTVFYHVFDCFGGAKVGFYFPSLRMFVSRLALKSTIAFFQYLVLRHASQYSNYLRSTKPRTICIPLETTSHLGHWFYNELEAVSQIFEQGLDDRVAVWLAMDQTFVPSARLFPGMSTREVVQCTGADATFEYCLRTSRMVVMPRLGDYYIGGALITQLRSLVMQDAADSGLDDALAIKLKDRWPVIWVEMRLNDRSWKNQAETLPILIETLSKKYPRVAVVMAGWSRINGSPPSAEAMIRKEELSFAEFSKGVPPGRLFLVSGETVLRKFRWAARCDAYLAVLGTGLIFPLLFERRGVSIANRVALKLLGPAFVNRKLFAGQSRLEFIPVDHVEDEEGDGNWQVRSFRIDPLAVTQYLDDTILSQLSDPASPGDLSDRPDDTEPRETTVRSGLAAANEEASE